MDKRIQKTKSALFEAFISIVYHKEASQISVSELCAEANINRTTFYKYYATPLDLIVEQLSFFTGRILEPMHQHQSSDETYEMLVMTFKTFRDNKWLLKLIQTSNVTILSYMQKKLVPYKNQNLIQNIIPYFISGGVSTITMQWIQEGCLESPEHLAKRVTELITRFQFSN